MMDDNLETFMCQNETKFQVNKKDNNLYINGKKVLTEEKITFSFWQALGAILITVAAFGSFSVSLVDFFNKIYKWW